MRDQIRRIPFPSHIRQMAIPALLLYLAAPALLLAFQPGKWSHTDPYILADRTGGPRRLAVLDGSGKLLKQALYSYNSSGRLLEERYLDGTGKEEGRTVFLYESGLLSKERLLDRSGKLVSLQEHHYKNGELLETVVHDAKGQELIRQIYHYRKGQIAGGEEISGNGKDPFQFLYDESGRLTAVQFLDSSKKVIAEILYHYNSAGQLAERIRTQAGTKSICRYTYSPEGRLASYTYFNEQDGKLTADRTLRLEY